MALVRCGVSRKPGAKDAVPLHFEKGAQSSSLGVKLRCKPKRKSNFGGWRRLAETFGEGETLLDSGLAVIRDHPILRHATLGGLPPIRACGQMSQTEARPPSMAKSAS